MADYDGTLGFYPVNQVAELVTEAVEITRKAKSNLALALRVLPKERRRDMEVFYAYCRVIDDLADDLSLSKEARREGLQKWADGLRRGFPDTDVLGKEVEEMFARRGIPIEWPLEVIEGCAIDLEPRTFGSWDELASYNWKVAGVVGLVSTRLFGCVHEDSDTYARHLGNALQLTNILRDVGEDLANGGRMYLPVNDMMRFQYSERDLVGRVYDGRFVAMMGYQAERAFHYFTEAERCMPEVDRRALLPARMMAEIYAELLEKMRRDRFRVFDRRYSVSKTRKGIILARHLLSPCR